MADEPTIPATPDLGEVAGITALDIGAVFADELRVSNDEIVKAKGGHVGVYEQVLRDEQCYSAFKQLRTDIISHETKVEPGGDRPIDREAAEDLKLQIEGLSWDAITKKMLTGIWNGYSVGECMFGVDGTHVLLRDIKVRKAKRFRFDKDDNLRLIRTDNMKGIVMPPAKMWIFKADADDDDDPYPLGLGYYCYWPVWFKRNVMRFWALWAEKFASPTPVVKFPAGAKEPEQKKALTVAKTVMSGAALAIPKTVELALLEALARAGDDYRQFCKYIDAANTKIILCQTMTTDDGSSKSQSETHADVKEDVTQTYSDLVCESFVRGPGTWLTQWNYPGAATPKVYRDFSEQEDLKMSAERDKTLVDVGYRPNAERVKETYGDGYEAIVQVPAVPAAPPATTAAATPQPPVPGAVAFAEPDAAVVGPAEDAIERLIGGDEWQKVIGPQVEEVRQFLEGASSLEDARDRLNELAQRDPKAITDSLARVMFAANIVGQVGAEVDAG